MGNYRFAIWRPAHHCEVLYLNYFFCTCISAVTDTRRKKKIQNRWGLKEDLLKAHHCELFLLCHICLLYLHQWVFERNTKQVRFELRLEVRFEERWEGVFEVRDAKLLLPGGSPQPTTKHTWGWQWWGWGPTCCMVEHVFDDHGNACNDNNANASILIDVPRLVHGHQSRYCFSQPMALLSLGLFSKYAIFFY